MQDATAQEKIEQVLQDFIQDVFSSDLARHLITSYRACGLDVE